MDTKELFANCSQSAVIDILKDIFNNGSPEEREKMIHNVGVATVVLVAGGTMCEIAKKAFEYIK